MRKKEDKITPLAIGVDSPVFGSAVGAGGDVGNPGPGVEVGPGIEVGPGVGVSDVESKRTQS